VRDAALRRVGQVAREDAAIGQKARRARRALLCKPNFLSNDAHTPQLLSSRTPVK